MKLSRLPSNMTESEYMERIKVRPKHILSKTNGKLRKSGIVTLSFPAHKALVVINGKLQEFVSCPNASACVAYCYAKSGCYAFSNVRIAHASRLQFLLDDPFLFVEQMIKEVKNFQKRMKNFRAVRFFDSGDINKVNFPVLMEVVKACPDVTFYHYTKSVSFMKEMKAAGKVPANLITNYSFGGTQDNLIKTDGSDRFAMAFPNRKMLRQYKMIDGSNSDVSASNPHNSGRIGLIAHGNWKMMDKIKKQVFNVVDKNITRLV
jgi:hypothetical protein